MEHVHSHVLIAANPKSGAASGGRRVAELREALIADGHACDVHYSLEELQCSTQRLEALGQLRAVVSAGGDGTAGALANLIPCHLPLLLFPLGTENLLAKHLKITGEVRQARTILQADQRTLLDTYPSAAEIGVLASGGVRVDDLVGDGRARAGACR